MQPKTIKKRERKRIKELRLSYIEFTKQKEILFIYTYIFIYEN